MRVIITHPGPDYSVADVYNGWCKGFQQLGVDLRPFPLHDRVAFYIAAMLERDGEHIPAFDHPAAVALALRGLEAACYEFHPDVVVVISGFYLDEHVLDMVRANGTKVVLVHTESPYEDDRQVERAQLADLNVLNDPTNLDRFPPGTVYLPHCYDPFVHRPRPAVKGLESEFFFVGTGYPSRISFFEQVDWSGITPAFGGSWRGLDQFSPLLPWLIDNQGECMDNARTVEHYCSTLTSANLYRTESNRPELSAGWAIGPREVELAACQTWFARDPRPEGDGLFPMLPTFTEPAELGDLIRWALGNPDARQDAALKAREAVTGRTFDRSAAEVLNLLNL